MSNTNQILLAGAAPDTGNLGVSALFYSTVAGISERLPDYSLTVFDHGKGIRDMQLAIKDNPNFTIQVCGAKHGRRYYHQENFANIRLSCKFGGGFNAIARHILNAKVMLDVSGGDSFTDLYGNKCFETITYPKEIAIENKIPLILLPQTYGPYTSSVVRNKAAKLVQQTAMAWARDVESFDELKGLLGTAFDEEKHFLGVDVAFLLPFTPPRTELSDKLTNWLNNRTQATVGINVSGLIYNQPDKARSQYGFKADYQQVIYQFVKKILAETDANIVLIPHVLVEESHYESDVAASKHLISLLSDSEKQRVEIVFESYHYDQCEIKWIISQMDWFCGTRMHSTIASLSTEVATAAIAYSLKTWRVFKTCGQELQVIDPREMDTQEVVDGLWECWQQRDKVKLSLQKQLPKVLAAAKQQMDLICANIANIK